MSLIGSLFRGSYARKCARGIFLVLLTVLVIATPLAGCFGARDLGERLDKVLVAVIADMVGPNAPFTIAAVHGFEDAVRYVNERGGVHRVQVEVMVKDTGSKAGLAILRFDEVVAQEPGPVLLFSPVPGLFETFEDRVAQEKVVTLALPWQGVAGTPEYGFAVYPGYPEMFGAFIDWLKEDWKGQGRPKVAFVTTDDIQGRAVLAPESYEYARSRGVDVVGTEVYSPHQVNVDTELARVRAAGADWIFTNAVGNGSYRLFEGLKNLGYRIPVAGSLGLDWSILRAWGKDMVEGVVAVLPSVSWDEEEQLKGLSAMRKQIFDRSSRNVATDMTPMYPIGVAAAMVGLEAVARAVATTGWQGLNGEAIRAEMLKLKDFSPLGLAYFTFTSEHHTPSKVRIYRFQQGKLLPVGDWRDVPDMRAAASK
ncbi:MAG: ABC transporter substrate-binding protein [Chloroflexota bacterium]